MSLENFWVPEQESIRRELEELDEDMSDPSDTLDNPQRALEDQDSSSDGDMMSARAVESLIKGVEVPADISALPPSIRSRAIRHLKGVVADRHFEIAQIYTMIVQTIDTAWRERGSLVGIVPTVEARVNELDLNREDRHKVEKMLFEFRKSVNTLARYERLGPEALIETFARPAWFLSPASDKKRDAQVTPYSIDVVIEDRDEFARFISGTIYEAENAYKKTIGLCYTEKNVPVTASVGDYRVRSTMAHERQHKLLRIIDTVLEPEHIAAWRARDELLAFFAGESVWPWTTPHEILKDELTSPSYEFGKKYGMAEDQYQKLIDEGIAAIKTLWESGLSSDEIIGILSFEPLRAWKKISERMLFSSKMRETVTARRVELNRQRIARANEIKKESDQKIKRKIESLPTPAISIVERQNPQGSFYRKISRRNLSVHLNELGITIDGKNILLDEPIARPGIYKVPIELHFETLYIDVEIKAV